MRYVIAAFGLALLCSSAGCADFDTGAVQCFQDLDCPIGTACESRVCVAVDGGTDSSGTCGDGVLDEGEACDGAEGTCASGAFCSAACRCEESPLLLEASAAAISETSFGSGECSIYRADSHALEVTLRGESQLPLVAARLVVDGESENEVPPISIAEDAGPFTVRVSRCFASAPQGREVGAQVQDQEGTWSAARVLDVPASVDAPTVTQVQAIQTDAVAMEVLVRGNAPGRDLGALELTLLDAEGEPLDSIATPGITQMLRSGDFTSLVFLEGLDGLSATRVSVRAATFDERAGEATTGEVEESRGEGGDSCFTSRLAPTGQCGADLVCRSTTADLFVGQCFGFESNLTVLERVEDVRPLAGGLPCGEGEGAPYELSLLGSTVEYGVAFSVERDDAEPVSSALTPILPPLAPGSFAARSIPFCSQTDLSGQFIRVVLVDDGGRVTPPAEFRVP